MDSEFHNTIKKRAEIGDLLDDIHKKVRDTVFLFVRHSHEDKCKKLLEHILMVVTKVYQRVEDFYKSKPVGTPMDCASS